MSIFGLMRCILLALFFFVSLAHSSDAQRESLPNVVQISGVVVVGDSLIQAPYTSVYRASDYRGTYTNQSGYFTLPAIEGDTLFFYSTGLKRSKFVVPRPAPEPHLSIVQVMEEDTIVLKATYILPLPSRENLRREVLAMNNQSNYFTISRPNSWDGYDGMYDFKEDALRQSQATITARNTNGFVSGGNLLDRNAWNNFIRSISSRRKQ